MIEDGRGHLLQADVEALVNTVNTVGHMGKGIALQFKQAYPENFAVYAQAVRRGEVRPGSMLVVPTGFVTNPHYIINFPTKRHWRGRSRVEDIEAGLSALVAEIERLGLKSIAIPPLGCGNGGLEWADVKPRIVRALEKVPDVRVLLFEPRGAPAPAEMPIRTRRPQMTAGRALLVKLMEQYLGLAFVFSDGHGVARFTAWYDRIDDLDKVDWEAAYSTWWKDTPEDMDRQRRKQAESLVHRSCPWGLLTEIGVYNETARNRVEDTLAAGGLGDTVQVRIRTEWYY